MTPRLDLWHKVIVYAKTVISITVLICGIVLGVANRDTHMWLLVILFSSQILLISDVLYSFLEYQYDLKNGLPRALDENGHPVTVKLS